MSASDLTARDAPSLFDRWVSLCNWLGRFPISILLLGCRFAVGLYWLKGVLLRLQSPQFGLALFQNEYKVPLLPPSVAMHLANFNEITCPILLMIGLFSRVATLPLLVEQLLVIQIFVFPSSYVDTLWLGSCMLFVLTRGPGAISLDYLVERHFAKLRHQGVDRRAQSDVSRRLM
jgi:putative oxidoreductase